MPSVQEQADELRALLRRAMKAWGGTLPPALATWWTAEQAAIAQEDARQKAKIDNRIADLNAKISALTSEREALEAIK